MPTDGASANERLLFAARTDNLEMYHEVLSQPGTFDVNFQDGLGNTALHYVAAQGSSSVLEELLEEPVDVDLHNRLDGNTPLHEAIARLKDEDLRNWIVNQLLEAGADPRERNKNNDLPIDLVNRSTPQGNELYDSLRKAQADAGIDAADIADDGEDESEEE